jgi:hypothetical protein
MTNIDVYEKNPLADALLNQGVAKVTGGRTETELATLRYELANFVCDGQYAAGLVRILTTFLSDLGKTEQTGVWVSGFFGSGKSHLVKMLQHLWVDTEFADGAKARGVAKLPSSVKDVLTELTNRSKQSGLHAAAGDLRTDAMDNIRLGLLGIIFRSVGLPGDYSRACFVLWLRDQGWESDVRKFIAAQSGEFEKELANLYVSELMAKAIIHVNPEFAAKPADVRIMLRSQFPPDKKDISVDEMIAAIRNAVGRKSKIPLTLVVLDEVQQYIGDEMSRSKAVQDIQEQCCTQLGPNFLLVATGQNALTGTPLLEKLTGRFKVNVELQDTDVEQVTREVILKKKPSAEPRVKQALAAADGEVSRHLASTKIGLSAKDRDTLVTDYPILPTRRRFWERVLRAVDTAGMAGQLRNQLWVVYDAVKQTANLPIGHVASGAHIYDSSIKSSALKSGTLLQEISETIAKQKGHPDGDLRYELCALIYLIGVLPHNNEPADAGVRANAETLADLLVTDLTKNSGELRKRVEHLLEALVADGAVMKVDDEYRMQTKEGSAWNQTYGQFKNKLTNDPGKFASERSQLFRTACGDALKRVKLLHGASKVGRKIELHFGDTQPAQTGETIPVWVRDGWEVTQQGVEQAAMEAGDTAAVVYVYITEDKHDELKQNVAGHYAAVSTIAAKGNPSTDEGVEAKRAMSTLEAKHLRDRDTLVTELLNNAIVFVAGGESVGGALLEEKVRDAATKCLARLFPQFHVADSADWHKVIERVRKGDGNALAAVGFTGDPGAHPVCKQIENFVGSSKKGTEVRDQFGGNKYGWPQDAIDAALMVLHHAGVVQARSGGKPVEKGKLDQKSIAAAEFRGENIKLTTPELMDLRLLFQKLLKKIEIGQESAQAGEFLKILTQLAEAAGGDSPFPPLPNMAQLTDLSQRVGNDQLKAIHAAKDTLQGQIADWQKRKELIAQRQPKWNQLSALLSFASDLPVAGDVHHEVEAIEANRSLLADPDPVPGMVSKVAEALRAALNEVHAECKKRHAEGMVALDQSATWAQLVPEQRYELLGAQRIRELPAIKVGTTEEVLDTLRVTKISEWDARRDALPGRFASAVAAAAKLLEPKAQEVSLTSATISTEDELKAWLADTEQRIRAQLKHGPVIV